MIYQEYTPHPALRAYIECYWSVTGKSSGYRPIYPDGCTDIIFNFGSEVYTQANGVVSRNNDRAFVVGNMLSPILTATAGSTDLFGIRFHAGALSIFTPVPIHHFNDTRAQLYDVISDAPNAEVLQSLLPLERIREMNRYFLQHLTDLASEPWRRCLQQIVQSRGLVNLHGLQKDVGITERSLERKFREHVGPGPKQLAQVLRFRKLRASIDAGSSKSLLSLAFDHGFTDHAHLTRFFKRYAGITPSEYTAMRD